MTNGVSLDTIKYSPIVRSKQSELLALERMPIDDKAALLPLIDLAAPSKANETKSPEEFVSRNILSLQERLKDFAAIILDSSEIELDLRLANDTHPLLFAGERLKGNDTIVIPVVSLARDADHIKAAIDINAEQVNPIVCVRIEDYDLRTPTRTSKNIKTLITQKFHNNRIIVLYDQRSTVNRDAERMANAIIAIDENIRDIDPIARIVAGCGLPSKISDVVKTHSEDYVPRNEVAMWRHTIEHTPPAGKMIFGDYTIVTPDSVELDWRIISRTIGPKIIYALDTHWFIVRGGPFRLYGWDQYRDLARKVIQLPDFPSGSEMYGDQYIKTRADGHGTIGNPASWLSAGISRHLSVTLHTNLGQSSDDT